MSKVFKSFSVTVDEDNRVTIDVAPTSGDGPTPVGHHEKPDNVEAEMETISMEEILADAKKKASDILAKAKSEAEGVIAEARRQAETEREEAKQQGYGEGHKEGYEHGVAEAESIRSEAQQVIDQAYVQKGEIIAEAEPEIIDMVEKLVQKILLNEAQLNPAVISILVRSGLSQMTLNGKVSVRVSKEDYPDLIERKDEVLASVEGMADIAFSEDLSLHKSDCIIETEFGNVDCGLDSQYKELAKSLYYLLKNR